MMETSVPEIDATDAKRRWPRVVHGLVRLQAVDLAPLLLLLLVITSFGFRMIWLDKPDGALIFDESYYVNAARVILGWPVADGAPYAGEQPGLDPNTEHPPGAKLLIAGSMWLLGDNAIGWRLPSVIFGTLSIPLLYGIVRKVGGTKAIALLATFLFAFDNLVLVHSRIATLDIFLLCFLLLGLYCYLQGWPTLAGLALVLATLCKIQGLYGIGVLVAFEGLRLVRARFETKRWRLKQLWPLLLMTVVYLLALPGLLGILDSVWSPYKNPVAHIRHILDYGFLLTRPDGPQGDESNPWQWLVNEVPMTYLRTDTQVLTDGNVEVTRATIFFRGAMNPYVVFMTPLAIAYAAYSAFKRRDDCSFLVLALFVVTYGPFWPAAILAHRISYIFYFLVTIPAVAIGAAQFMYAAQTPRLVRWAYIGAVLLGFYTYFPFRQVP
jgi:predicted membrane-bound dolichyl-phosphate-mannose-protein mannosyltransferase